MSDTSWVRSYSNKGVVAGGFYHTSYGSSDYLLTSDGGATSKYGLPYLPWKEQWIDMTGYSESYWHPVVTSLPYKGYKHIKVTVQLNSGSVPSWSTHSSGFTCNLDLLVTAHGWGNTQSQTICLNSTYGFADYNPVGWYQLGNASHGILLLRGGGKYLVCTDWDSTWTIYNQSVTDYEGTQYAQTCGPYTSWPGIFNGSTTKNWIYAHLEGNVITNDWLRIRDYAGSYHGRSNNISGYAGEIWFGGNFHIDSQNGYSLYLNYYSEYGTYINPRGGNVGIGTISPSEKLQVTGGVILQEVNNSWLTPARVQIGRKDTSAYTDRSCIGTTDGNLHIDPYSGHSLYLNYYNHAVTYFSGGSYYISSDGSYYNGSCSYASNAGYATSAGSSNYSTYLKGPDNRSTNNDPSWYMTNRGSASLYGEFCMSGGAISSTYEYRMTMTPWGNNSGQRPVQLAFNNSGMFMRTSASDSAWNSWATIITSDNISNYATNTTVTNSAPALTKTAQTIATIAGTAITASVSDSDKVDGYHATDLLLKPSSDGTVGQGLVKTGSGAYDYQWGQPDVMGSLTINSNASGATFTITWTIAGSTTGSATCTANGSVAVPQNKTLTITVPASSGGFQYAGTNPLTYVLASGSGSLTINYDYVVLTNDPGNTCYFNLPGGFSYMDIFLVNGGNGGADTRYSWGDEEYGGKGGKYLSQTVVLSSSVTSCSYNIGVGGAAHNKGGRTSLTYNGTTYQPAENDNNTNNWGSGVTGYRNPLNGSDGNYYGAEGGAGAGYLSYPDTGDGYSGGSTGGGHGGSCATEWYEDTWYEWYYREYCGETIECWESSSYDSTNGSFYGAGGGGGSYGQWDYHPGDGGTQYITYDAAPASGYQGCICIKFHN